MRTFGVEEEFLLVNPATGNPVPVALAALTFPATDPEWHADGIGSRLTGELQLEQLEVSTVPCSTLSEIAEQLRAGRCVADTAAAANGARITALATSPLPVSPHLRANPRYRKMAGMHGIVAEEQLTCGMHIHVEVGSDAEGVGVLDHVRVWLPVLLALSANSPFWQGRDTGFASFRSRVWNRWPSSGPTPLFGSVRAYTRLVEELLATGVLLDPGMVYFDARLSNRYPTVEIRVPDVCLEVETAELIAGLARGLVEVSAKRWAQKIQPPAIPETLLRTAMWLAARNGMRGDLLDPATALPVAAAKVATDLLEHVAGSAGTPGEEARIRHLLSLHLRHGGGADRQRTTYARTAELESVVTDAVSATHGQTHRETELSLPAEL
ncbi:carboxylate--amine ligase [Arthrobacter psychrolactophilus]|uniref:Putative glutamate--cysteine ligase 2 n=1 Tax=Arthrobacter psychrolactophilus TaxID=92442 RepID=A0A2V5JG08_9MICC|nr:glutamate--cysteine ligase [Arthrobacter psychrolactophilus]PYI38637.1 carboxylate--amine ligase [Arthrobacter psychrolactophilus]